jgi:hypothetical protein
MTGITFLAGGLGGLADDDRGHRDGHADAVAGGELLDRLV